MASMAAQPETVIVNNITVETENTIPLPTLAKDIMAAHIAALASVAASLHHAKRAGDLLLQAKGQLKHGEWEQWLAANCNFSLRMAQVYMQIARGWPRLQEHVNAYSDTHLDITEARRLLRAKPKTNDDDDEHADEDEDEEDDLGEGGCGDDDPRDETQLLSLVFPSLAAINQFRNHVNDLTTQFAILETNEANRLAAVVAQAHAALVRRVQD